MPEALSRFQLCFEAICRIQRAVDGFASETFVAQGANEELMILPARSLDHPFTRRPALQTVNSRAKLLCLSPSETFLSLSVSLPLSQGRGDQSVPGPGYLGSRPDRRTALSRSRRGSQPLGGRYRVRLRAAAALSPALVWSPWTEAADSADS